MPEKTPTLYNVHKTTIWFSISGVALFAGLILMVVEDSSREWKVWQNHFMEFSRHKAEEELAKAKEKVDPRELDRLREELEKTSQAVAEHAQEVQKIEGEVKPLEVEVTKARSRYQDLKQYQDSDRYFFEHYQAEGDKKKAKQYKKVLEERASEIESAKHRLEGLEGRLERKKGALAAITGKGREIGLEVKRITGEVERVERKIENLRPSWEKDLLNAPMVDFLKPTLQVQQIVLQDLRDDYYFTHVQKVDRCITCHLGIDQPGFEDAPQPFRTHPKLDLFLAPNSPHPMEEIGCTVCHGGSGHSVSFVTAAHTPHSKEQAEAWKKAHHWKPMKHWAEKMLPLHHVEASCAKCHAGTMEVPGAPKLNEGRRLAREFGCVHCHKIQGFGLEETWRTGPSLLHVQSKLEPDWIIRWLHNPKEFRPSTKMPRFFHLENISDPEGRETSDVTISGMAAYLAKHSDPVALEAPRGKGDPEIGKKLVEEVGCLGCHTVGDKSANDHGPELSALGSKVKPEWLYTWLKDPRHFSAETRMPNLRLTDEEAAHITSYLLAQKNEKFDSLRLPHMEPAAVERLAMHFLTGKMRFQEAKAELEKMSPEERLEFIGEKSIAHFGCFSCHTIKGFEGVKPIGTELTLEGSKEVERLDFGFVPIEHTRQDWFFQKLKKPRVFDQGKDKPYHDKLRMPQFDFKDEEAEVLVTFLLSLQRAEIPLAMQKQLSSQEMEIEHGRFLVEKLNCQGCHTLDGREGRVRRLLEDPGNAPPVLDGEGKKVQPDWLYDFLESPETVRPWLKYRMPTFGFNEAELTALVQYFNHLSDAPPDFLAAKKPEASPQEIAAGRQLFQTFQCIKCHKTKPDPSLSASFLAPDLVISKERLRPQWVIDWLKDPQALQPGTMMPTFFPEGSSPATDVFGGDAARQIEALRDYLWEFTAEEAAAVGSVQK